MERFRVISSKPKENGVPEWNVSILLSPADARVVAKTLVIEGFHNVAVVRVCEEFFAKTPACGGCEYLEEGTCEGKEHTCESFRRFK